jgi:quercetin 2,3-dioxygenase
MKTLNQLIYKSEDRGHLKHGWLDAYHSFSFGNYYNPEKMNYHSIRVLNEDRINPSQGFPMHPHRDMEIITYVLEGSLAHEDSMGNKSVIKAGDVQRMSAGTGIVHSEANPSQTEQTHLFQIWIEPEKEGLEPGYEEINVSKESKLNHLKLIGSNNPKDGAVKIHSDIKLYSSILEKGLTLEYKTSENRHLWIQCASGVLEVNGGVINTGDAIAIGEIESIDLLAKEKAEFLLFDCA